MIKWIGISLLVIFIIVAATLLYHTEKQEEAGEEFPDLSAAWWENYPELGEGSITYEVCPVDENMVTDILPLGHIFYHKRENFAAHPIPTSHTYWSFRDFCELFAPADGVITAIEDKGTGYTIEITHTNTFRSVFVYLGELSQNILEKAGELRVGRNKTYIPVKAGDKIGYLRGGLEFGACDRTVNNFVHPEKYIPNIRHAVCPLDYFREPLRSKLLDLTNRIIEPRGGQVDFDEPGKLVGNWILENTRTTATEDGWKKFVAFVYDLLDPRYLAVSLSAEALPPYGGLFRVKGNGPDFRTITVESGEVVYKLMETLEGIERLAELYPDRWSAPSEFVVQYTLLVKMIDNEKIKLEVFPGDVPNPTFTERAKYYTR